MSAINNTQYQFQRRSLNRVPLNFRRNRQIENNFIVDSESRDGTEYEIIRYTNGTFHCGCPDYVYHRHRLGTECKHIEYLREQIRIGRERDFYEETEEINAEELEEIHAEVVDYEINRDGLTDLPNALSIRDLEFTRTIVNSDSGNGQYEVRQYNNEEWRCSCPDYVYRRHELGEFCKHIDRVRALVNRNNRQEPQQDRQQVQSTATQLDIDNLFYQNEEQNEEQEQPNEEQQNDYEYVSGDLNEVPFSVRIEGHENIQEHIINSDRRDGTQYQVLQYPNGQWRCGCPDYVYNRHPIGTQCKHIQRLINPNQPILNARPRPRTAPRPQRRTTTQPKPQPQKLEFKVSEQITLKLQNNQTMIYVNGRAFQQCRYLLLNLKPKNFSKYDEIESIDEAIKIYDRTHEHNKGVISPTEEFWGHCSNLQTWVENNYDTRILHSNLAFPLLRLLSQSNEKARIIYKEEILKRIESGYIPVIQSIINNGYIHDNLFTNEEKQQIKGKLVPAMLKEIEIGLKTQLENTILGVMNKFRFNVSSSDLRDFKKSIGSNIIKKTLLELIEDLIDN